MKTMRPRIGMTVTQFPEYDGFKLRRDYVRAIEMAGGLPLLIPVCGEELIEDYLDSIDGLLLTGGDDFLPELFGGCQNLWNANLSRSATILKWL